MLYLINSKKRIGKSSRTHNLFESNTESQFLCNNETLEELVFNYKFDIKNINILDKTIITGIWQKARHDEYTTYEHYIVLGKTTTGDFKVLDSEGNVSYVSEDRLRILLLSKSVINYTIDKDSNYKLEDTQRLTNNKELEAQIDEKYSRHIALTAMLGKKSTFGYKIEGNEVMLTKYTGTSEEVILPNFVTTIKSSAFSMSEIKSITLNHGLRYIGRNAFAMCKLSELIIPETVEFMFTDAVYGNKALIHPDATLKESVKFNNNKTKVIDFLR